MLILPGTSITAGYQRAIGRIHKLNAADCPHDILLWFQHSMIDYRDGWSGISSWLAADWMGWCWEGWRSLSGLWFPLGCPSMTTSLSCLTVSRLLYDSIMNKFACYTSTQYSYSTLGVIRVTHICSHHPCEGSVTHNGGNSLLKWGEWILSSPLLSSPPACLGHALAVGSNPSLHVHLDVQPLFLISASVCCSKPTAITVSHTHSSTHSTSTYY